jgi:hypothetical protein
MTMPKFIAVHKLPADNEELAKKIIGQTAKQIPKEFTWKLTSCDVAKQKFVCEWEAPNKERLEEALRTQGLSVESIRPAK